MFYVSLKYQLNIYFKTNYLMTLYIKLKNIFRYPVNVTLKFIITYYLSF